MFKTLIHLSSRTKKKTTYFCTAHINRVFLHTSLFRQPNHKSMASLHGRLRADSPPTQRKRRTPRYAVQRKTNAITSRQTARPQSVPRRAQPIGGAISQCKQSFRFGIYETHIWTMEGEIKLLMRLFVCRPNSSTRMCCGKSRTTKRTWTTTRRFDRDSRITMWNVGQPHIYSIHPIYYK